MSKTRYNLDLVFANVFFGANFSFYVSLTRNYLDFQQIFMLQVLSAAVFFIPFALFSRYSYRITWRDVGNILIVTLLIVYGWMYMLLWGSSYTTPIDASVIATLGPAFTLIMDHLMHPRKYIGTRVVGVVCALVGAGILILGDGFSLTHGSRAQGNLFVLAAVVAIAVNTVIIKPQLEKLGTLVVMGWYYIIGLAITAPFFWKYIDHVPFLRLPLFAQAELGYILILGTVLPMYLLYRGTEKLTSVHTALYRYIQPVIAGILAITRGQAHFDAAKPTLLLNSHHDTVRPTAAWTRDPFAATWEGERLYGLGANDTAQRRTAGTLIGQQPFAPGVGNRFAPLACEVEDDHHRAAFAAHLAAGEQLLEERQALRSHPFAGGRHPHGVVHPDLPQVGGRGRDGENPQVCEQHLRAQHLFVELHLAHVEIHLLRDVVHVLKGVHVGEPFLNRGFERARHLIRG